MLNKKIIFFFSFFLAAMIVGGGHIICLGQDEEKSIQSEELVNKRPIAKTTIQPVSTNVVKNRKLIPVKKTRQERPSYKVIKSINTKSKTTAIKIPPKQLENALLGFTVWKLRPATKSDSAKELIEEERDGKIMSSEYTLERLLTESPLSQGERIRLSVESLSHSGYLYVVERELYSDGSFSNPKLIYPTLRSRYKSNPVSAGTLVFVPEGTRNFRVTSTQIGKEQVAEVLTIIVSPKMLVEQSALQMKAIDMPVEMMSDWLNKWEVDTSLLEQVDGVGQTITLDEQSASRDSAKGLNEEATVLTQDDAVPQAIFRSKIKKGNPVLVNVYLNYKSN